MTLLDIFQRFFLDNLATVLLISIGWALIPLGYRIIRWSLLSLLIVVPAFLSIELSLWKVSGVSRGRGEFEASQESTIAARRLDHEIAQIESRLNGIADGQPVGRGVLAALDRFSTRFFHSRERFFAVNLLRGRLMAMMLEFYYLASRSNVDKLRQSGKVVERWFRDQGAG